MTVTARDLPDSRSLCFPAQGDTDATSTARLAHQRRVARTTAAIEDAFSQLVLEQGYERVTVDDICDRADLARATIYPHYPNKEAVLLSVSSRLTEDLMGRIAYQDGPWNMVRRGCHPVRIQTRRREPRPVPGVHERRPHPPGLRVPPEPLRRAELP